MTVQSSPSGLQIVPPPPPLATGLARLLSTHSAGVSPGNLQLSMSCFRAATSDSKWECCVVLSYGQWLLVTIFIPTMFSFFNLKRPSDFGREKSSGWWPSSVLWPDSCKNSLAPEIAWITMKYVALYSLLPGTSLLALGTGCPNKHCCSHTSFITIQKKFRFDFVWRVSTAYRWRLSIMLWNVAWKANMRKNLNFWSPTAKKE